MLQSLADFSYKLKKKKGFVRVYVVEMEFYATVFSYYKYIEILLVFRNELLIQLLSFWRL